MSYKLKRKILFLYILCFITTAARTQDSLLKTIISEDLYIVRLTPNTLQHVSFTSTPAFGRFSSNGLIYINNKEAVVMDTPPDGVLTKQLLNWFAKNHPGISIKAVIVNHFHSDCIGGLYEFHKAGIPSYAYRLTPLLIKEDAVARPQVALINTWLLPLVIKKYTVIFWAKRIRQII